MKPSGKSQLKYHQHIGLQSKSSIISAGILLIVSAVRLKPVTTTSSENSIACKGKYRTIRPVYPEIAAWTDSIYFQNPEFDEQETEKHQA
ncbi:hypothetical protein DSL64_28565 [Dyadobacter luteus]|uniref:Uncharacterized protein n=1 Tax=Dyadobacter luteus TaxID=2259619 RepID=A0A3D8Y339_9BACT|nr:hypothetical protein DSL64_28565 [Dyadobacter luteus]